MNIVGDYGKWFKFINENQHNSKFEICLFIPKSNAGNVLASSNWLQLAQFIDKKGFECMTSFNNSTNTRRGENKRMLRMSLFSQGFPLGIGKQFFYFF